MKYYCNRQESLFYSYNDQGYLIGFDGENIYIVLRGGEKKLHPHSSKDNFNEWFREGYFREAAKEFIKEFGLTKEGFYIAKSGKPFSVKVGGEFSKYVWERKENGDWEPAMVEGPDYNAYYEVNSERAQTFDKKVESGLWIKAEVEEK